MPEMELGISEYFFYLNHLLRYLNMFVNFLSCRNTNIFLPEYTYSKNSSFISLKNSYHSTQTDNSCMNNQEQFFYS